MKKRRPYKHTEKYLRKKAEKEQRRAIALAQRRAEKQLEIKLKREAISHWFFILAYLATMYGISEMEILFGSNDAFLQKRIIVAREYLKEIYESGKTPTIQGIEDYFQDFAIEEYCKAIEINSDVYDSLCGHVQKEKFLQRALEFTYNFVKIEENIKRSTKYTKEEFLDAGHKNYEKLKKIDLRKGSTERRNSKRFQIVKLILEHLKELEEGTLSLRNMAKEHSVNRDSLGKYYKSVKNMIKLGIEIDEHSFDEKKRGRKANPYCVISKEILTQLEKDLEDIPAKCGLNYASWTGDAIHEYLKTFYDLEVDLHYLYDFLRANKIVSKSASRKNPNANPEDVEEFKKSLYGKFKYAIRNNLEVIFLDETHVQQGSRTRGYAKIGKEAVYSFHTENLHCEYTLLTLIGFDFVMIFKHKHAIKSEDYANYLEELHKKYPEQKFLIFRDNAKIHTSKEVTESLKESGTDKFIEFESIPAYSPELNPVELMNNEFKEFLKKYECESRNNVSKRADDFIEKFQDTKKNSKKSGRRKAKQYLKGKHCSFIFYEYVRAMKDIRKEHLKVRKNNHFLESVA